MKHSMGQSKSNVQWLIYAATVLRDVGAAHVLNELLDELGDDDHRIVEAASHLGSDVIEILTPDHIVREWSGDRRSFGGRLRIFRHHAGLSAEELAELTGHVVSRSVIANIESGRTGASNEQAQALCDALNIPVPALDLNVLVASGE